MTRVINGVKAGSGALLLVSLLTAWAGPAGAAMYKWVDEQGNVHYTQTPPPSGKAERIAPTSSRRYDAPDAPKAGKPSKATSVGKKADTDGASEADSADAERDEAYRRNCEAARKNLEVYTRHRRIMNKSGEVVVLGDDEREAKIAEAQGMIDKFCKD